MNWLHQLDVGLLRFINQTLSNPFFDWLMPFASGNVFFFPAVALAGLLLLWKGGAHGRLCVLMLVLIVWPGDSFVCNTIKHAVARPRPFSVLPDLRQPASGNRNDMARPDTAMMEMAQSREAPAGTPAKRISYTSMPSSHTANMFAATMVLFVYYRRSLRFMLPLACLVAFSRIYNGVHYPSDVLAGMILGAGYAAAGLWTLNALWQWAGRKWFPLWWERLPSLVKAEGRMKNAEIEAPAPAQSAIANRQSAINEHWLRLGYLFIAVQLIGNLLYLYSGLTELTGDEAYQWLWSKRLALSYYSKPPMVAYLQFVSTHLFGDNQFGVRFFAPWIGATISFLMLRFCAREVSARVGFFLLLILLATPLMMLGTVIMTIDPPVVMFWTAALVAGWRAVQPDGKTRHWLWTGLWMALGFLSKYVELMQWLCWAVFFILWKPARVHLRRRGPYLALLINLLGLVPVLIWNAQNGWGGVGHLLKHNARLDKPWEHTTRYFVEFAVSETLVLNPFFVIAVLWASIAFWRRFRNDPRLLYMFSMGAPVFLCYLIYSFHSRILPNWIAPSIAPLFCLMVIYWDDRWRSGARFIKAWLAAGLAIGLTAVAFMHEPDLVKVFAGKPLPSKVDPLTRARGFSEMARIVSQARTNLLAEGKPVFIIGAHYQMASMLTFYLPEAKPDLVKNPLVFFPSSDEPVNQFYFWPQYKTARKGQNAIFVVELGSPYLMRKWFWPWLVGERELVRRRTRDNPPAAVLEGEFESITNLGQFDVYYHGRIFHTIQLFECRNLK